MKVSVTEAARALGLHPHSVTKLLDARVLIGPVTSDGRRQGVYVDSLQTAQSVLPASLAPGDVAFHVGAAAREKRGKVEVHQRTYLGWHAEESLALPLARRRNSWGRVWNMTEDNAADLVGRHAVCDVAGFIVDVARIAAARRCPCCELAVFDLVEPDDLAISRYRGRRITVSKGSLFTVG